MTESAVGKRTPDQVVGDIGLAIVDGKAAAAYLWQVPDDAETLLRVARLLGSIRDAGAKRGLREMPAVCAEMLTALGRVPGTQQADILQEGFARLDRLWRSA